MDDICVAPRHERCHSADTDRSDGSWLRRDVLWYFLHLGTFGFGGPIALAGYMQRDLVRPKDCCVREIHL